ncbi:MAG: helix-turn-helix transcriptional regulator [Gordonia sp. (in: high G+C Gram-positive bacteria)]|uniref:helix-turn-helix transcriptional regulator n=1 Tax=Gordonia sp. (in: high G+C Gram-positive bacteria) TaxID=84139 RepID=UPI003BB70700
MSRTLPEASPGGLGEQRVAAWKERLRALGGDPAVEPTFRIDAAAGRVVYGFDQAARTIPDDFECYMYVSPLVETGQAVCSLRTPVTAVWDERAARDRPGWADGDDLVVSTLLNVEDPPLFIAKYGDTPLRGSMTPLELAELILPANLLGRRRVLTETFEVAPLFVGTVLARATAAFVARFAANRAVREASSHTDADDELAAVEVIINALGGLAGSTALIGDSPVLLREAALAAIERNYSEPQFDVESIAAELYVSRRHLYRAFEGADQSLAGLIAERRVEAAKATMRRSPHLSVGAVADRCGFASVDTFRSRFRAIVGLSPSDYRVLEQRGR